MSQVLAGYIESELKNKFGSEIKDPEKFADAIAKAIQTYLINNVTVSPGQDVATVGTAAAQRGATTTPGTLIAQS